MSITIADISYYAPKFIIVINGIAISAWVSKTVLSVSIDQELNRTNNFRFEVQDEVIGGRFQWLGLGHDLFKYGNNVTILMGYVHNMHKMLEGKVQNISANFTQGTAPTFSVEGSDSAYEFLMERSEPHVFREKTDSDIAIEISQMAHLQSTVDDTEQVHPVKTKIGSKSYFEFLKDMADSNSFEFYLSGRKLFFVRGDRRRPARLNLLWGKNLINFRSTLNTTQAITGVVVRSWDGSGRRTIEGRARAGEETRQEEGQRLSSQVAREIYGDRERVITDRPVNSVDDANREARSELERAGDNLIRGSAETIGMPELKTAVGVNLLGLGEWFSGKYYVEKVTHRIDNSGYRTNFEAKRNSL